jgi:hypothetical protein
MSAASAVDDDGWAARRDVGRDRDVTLHVGLFLEVRVGSLRLAVDPLVDIRRRDEAADPVPVLWPLDKRLQETYKRNDRSDPTGNRMCVRKTNKPDGTQRFFPR